jgi:hypothetical protein
MPGLSLSCGMRQRQTVRLYFGKKQTLSLEQKHALRQEQIHDHNERYDQFLNLVRDVWGHEMQPSARCERCEKTLSITEIVLGFKTDVNDFTTECPRCKYRFEATNMIDQRTGREHGFWCALQTLERLPGLEKLETEELRVQQPEIFFSAIFHFGSLLYAFKRAGIEYRRERINWISKAKFCLGHISDRDVSELFGVSRNEVSRVRNELRIPKYVGKGSIIPVNREICLVA